MLREGKDIALISIGEIGNAALAAAEKAKETAGIEASLYDMIFLKPIDEEILHHVGKNFDKIITLEDGTISGGLGSAVAEFMTENGYKPRIRRIGIPDTFIPHGKPLELEKLCKTDTESICNAIMEECRK